MPGQRSDSTRSANNTMGSIPQLPSIEEAIMSTSVASTSNVSATSSRRGKTLTISRKETIESKRAKKWNANDSTSRIAPMVKWFVALTLGLSFLACLGASKFSLIRLTQSLRDACKDHNNVQMRTRATRRFLMLVMTMVIPATLNFLRAVWIGGSRRDLPWPKKRAIVLTVVSAVMESAGLCLFVCKILIYYKEVSSILMTSMVLVIPFADNARRFLRNRRDPNVMSKPRMTVVSLGLLLQVAGLCIMAYFAYQHIDDVVQIWHLPIAVGCLSFAWCPSIQKDMMQSSVEEERDDDEDDDDEDGPRNLAHTTSTQQSSIYGSASANSSGVAKVTKPKKIFHKKSTWKTSIISHAVKIPCIFVFSFVLFYFDDSIYGGIGLTEQAHSEFVDAWDDWFTKREFTDFLINVLTSIAGYFLAFLACHGSMQKLGFAVPLFLSFPAYVTVLFISSSCGFVLKGIQDVCQDDFQPLWLGIVGCVVVMLGLILSTSWFVFRTDRVILQNETRIFWLPSFNGVFLDQWLLLNRQCYLPDKEPDEPMVKFKLGRVYICTTMYRETTYEMRQLLKSISRVNYAREDGGRFFESHVIFDGGVRKRELSSFALQLISLLEPTLGINPDTCTKLITPYGMRLSWNLPVPRRCNPMTFNIHLKDNHKVKNKKRWSQVMYMSYVLDFLTDDAKDEECFVLTTDADVKFTPESVEALLDLMTRDSTVGAVCARTHPVGSGPLVWYQVFEYAIGHWFQKAAEHVLGSVLCAPGCFSVYRCRAIKDILCTYATGVEHAFDFLIKDMGEDRWLCTLMVQSGWRIEYCAASENSTNCPQEFEEFYKQRRRWIASTIANLMLIVQKWRVITRVNQRVSVLFIIYQGSLLFSTMISPSTVILIVAGGLSFAWDIHPVTSIVLQILISVIFVLVCLYASDKIQILTAQFLTFLYAIVMSAVAVGTAEQIVTDISSDDKDISFELGISATTFYFICLAGMFILAALLHPREFLCLFHALWYLLCLPSGYLVLNLYSICNITDRSWGTREEKIESSITKEPWETKVKFWFKKIFFCCFTKENKETTQTFDVEVQTPAATTSTSWRPAKEHRTSTSGDHHDQYMSVDSSSQSEHPSDKTDIDYHQLPPGESTRDNQGRSSESEDNGSSEAEDDIALPVSVEDWLPVEFKTKYAQSFRQHGFDNTMFISGMNEKELKDIGIKTKTHKKFILDQIELLPAFEIEYHVPGSIKEWLDTIGLTMYQDSFKRCHIRRPKDLSILKTFGRKEVEKELKITKAGHIKRLMYAIRKLRNPTEAEKSAIDMKGKIDASPTHFLKESNVGEYDFWETLRHECLKPGTKAFGIEEELKVKLCGLRNSWLLIFAVCNTLWLILITTLASKGNLTILGANPIGLSFIFIFGTIFLIQFLAMWIHRFNTAVHFIARAPYRCGAPLKNAWSFKDKNLERSTMDPDEWNGFQALQTENKRIQERLRRPHHQRQPVVDSVTSIETSPLLSEA
ncbi:uncharacterized protein LOC121373551 [Gigantopelta aegis]|uniref:uncharacterized protein LOC121373551 n=1 Tax=Gigantopelta aegis TaxID=1735272 RepID=UPI001B88A849|nr:uncharacterized protein LOC121373551 [Gigantopelta aegis]XP_041356162.1 uncharacterized protein LOC121373551 [Gigantopelta aegis]